MKKKVSIFCLIFGILILIIGATIFFFNKNEDTKKLDDIKDSITADYDVFRSKIETFSTERTGIYESLNNISYLSQLATNYDDLISEYNEYEDTLKEIDKSSKSLKVNCLENNFEEKEINNKVDAFIINYEQAVNYFIKDVEVFNKEIEKYNQWVEDVQVTNKYSKLAEYKSSYTEYVDINNDGVFNGVDK